MMSVWVIRYKGHRPVAVCEDLGDIVSFKLLEHGREFAVTNTTQEYRIYGQMVAVRHSGRAPIGVPLTRPRVYDAVTPPELLKEGGHIDESTVVKDLRSANNYLCAYCIDPSVLALVNGSVDLMFMHVDKSKYERLYQIIPSKEKAEEYLRASGFTFGKWYTFNELRKISPRGEWRQRYMKVGAISILLD